MLKKGVATFLTVICLFFHGSIAFCTQETKYPDYAYEFLGTDKWENINRKVFNFNLKLNKYAIRPIHILWASVMPQYGMDRIKGISDNIEYPMRLVSSLIQKDFKTSRNETVRFFTNTILGLGGMFDPAKHLFKLEQAKENMEQALTKCKMKPGTYFVMPVMSFTNMRAMLGKTLDMALNPTCYIATPILAIVKAALTINKTSFVQPLIKMVESTYADPYEIAKKAFGIDSYIKYANLDRLDVLSLLHTNCENKITSEKNTKNELEVKKTLPEKPKQEKDIVKMEVSSQIVIPDLLYGGANIDESFGIEDFKLGADILLNGYNPQNPVVDSMRTSLFYVPGVNKSIWNDISIWNRSFARRIKTGKINISEGREDYNYHYLLQKNKTSPLAVIFPSIGEGVNSNHSVIFAKLFYDAGYSILILGSHFQWEFVKSMPEGYYPGLPAQDAEFLSAITSKIEENLSAKYDCNFDSKTFIGTSFGALTSMFIGAKEYNKNNTKNIRIISICPPIELIYAMKQFDKNSEDWKNSSEDFKQRVAQAAAKVVKIYQNKDDIKFEINNLPFSEEEGKLITGFVMHQKLSDLVYTIEKAKNSDIYTDINNMNYEDYAKKYLIKQENMTVDDLSYETSLYAIANYLENGDNYKIYHSINDYLTNQNQLKKLKAFAKNKLTLIDNGAHLGFLYRKEFIEDLKNTISKAVDSK